MVRARARGEAATRITPQRWQQARRAVLDAGERFAALVESAPDPAARAVGRWSVADTAAHVTAIALNNTAVVAGGTKPFPIPEVRPHLPATTLATLSGGMNAVQLDAFAERDPTRLAARLREALAEVLDTTEHADPTTALPWLGGSRLPLAGLLAHLSNELLVHGWDIARASGVPWELPEEQAALFLDLFLVELTRHGHGRLLDDHPDPPRPIAVGFHSTRTEPVTMVLGAGVARVEEGGGPCDVHLRFRPSALNLVVFHRIGRARAALTGGLLVWGRRPWLLEPFLRKVRMP
ncbi:maleylpyruvate isomerase family mycothiol-dependent enzyme [Actinosynnema mirum]|uniref:Mycothiol-dependent maleylpyruvate isomerase metal-binding domain-containing protein n=1 Tax=Actinosynnema mirum (strain ATCC 29888 / DSM 43827 / JCM 3225 / NBRC 14064 / NCIMB 13271 / NRRL B-12336 / IMRU 3971 / 101) TaxID=446462 RepID=C6WG16_ACTMD|nr:maleylpyruvate isomerase family mycothiol-dependent enzyme [Actinosynnema mirum]ACU37952.1 hypothetical protein Amir_4096 [Actinosynnema mirum DSM 43827]